MNDFVEICTTHLSSAVAEESTDAEHYLHSSISGDAASVSRLNPSESPASAVAHNAAASNIVWHLGRVTTDQRKNLMGHEPVTFWFTGLSGSGKSTIAFEIEHRLINARHACVVLDGDNVRHGLNRDLGFSPRERTENLRRVAEVAKILNDAGLIVLTAFISPYRNDRDAARRIIGEDRFVETYLTADLRCCEARDPKGLYAKARRGEVPGFTGIDAPYERPLAPDIALDTSAKSLEQCVSALLRIVAARFVSFTQERIAS